MKCGAVGFEKPNTFVVTFDSMTSKEMCERESARLQGVLSQAIGEAVKIRFVLDAPAVVVPEERISPHQADRERYLAVMENPLVRKIQETFGVTLHKVEH